MTKLLFICLGNICRSPLAEATFRALVDEQGLEDRFEVDSAGTAGYHIGDSADRRAIENGAKHGIKITHLARKLSKEDLDAFDHLVVMDEQNFEDVHRFYYETKKTPPPAEKLFLLRDYDLEEPDVASVPDPYYDGAEAFENVYQIVKRCNEVLLKMLLEKN